jgi:hypothetical protein
MENILHHQKDGWNPIDNGILPTYQLVQDFATIHYDQWRIDADRLVVKTTGDEVLEEMTIHLPSKGL